MAIEATTIEELAVAPLEVTSDGQTVKERPIADVIAAQDRTASQTAATKAHRGLRFTKLVPPGARGSSSDDLA